MIVKHLCKEKTLKDLDLVQIEPKLEQRVEDFLSVGLRNIDHANEI